MQLTQYEQDFWSTYDMQRDGCWEWSGPRNDKGYGMASYKGGSWGAHQLSFLLFYGWLPEVVRHKCDNPPCGRPDHLQEGNHESNMRDRQERGRQAWGAKNGRAKLTADDIVDIVARLDRGEQGSRIAAIYLVDKSTISRIKTRSTWNDPTPHDPAAGESGEV